MTGFWWSNPPRGFSAETRKWIKKRKSLQGKMSEQCWGWRIREHETENPSWVPLIALLWIGSHLFPSLNNWLNEIPWLVSSEAWPVGRRRAWTPSGGCPDVSLPNQSRQRPPGWRPSDTWDEAVIVYYMSLGTFQGLPHSHTSGKPILIVYNRVWSW